MEQELQLVIVFFAALAAGGLMVNWIGLGRAMSRLSASTYVEFHQATNHTFDPYMPIVVVGALLGGIVLAIFLQGFIRFPANLRLLDLSFMPQSWRLPCSQTSGSTNRSHAGQCRARPMIGRSFAPVGFDFTSSALSFYFQHWPVTSSLVLSVDDSVRTAPLGEKWANPSPPDAWSRSRTPDQMMQTANTKPMAPATRFACLARIRTVLRLVCRMRSRRKPRVSGMVQCRGRLSIRAYLPE